MGNKTAIFNSNTRTFQLQNVNLHDAAPGEVIVRVRGCTICGSDLHTFAGRRSGPQHSVLGHEIIGNVVQCGGGHPVVDYYGNPLKTGQRITWGLTVSCKDCFSCRNGIPQKCHSLFKYGHEPCSDSQVTGGLSEYCTLLPGTDIFPIPDSLPDAVACPANCATATVMGTFRLAEQLVSISGKTVLVSGLGMLGLTACSCAQSKGAQRIIAVDVDPKRLELASTFGASDSILASADDIEDTVRSITQGHGVDLALEFAGVPDAVSNGLRSLRVGGTLMLAGSVFPCDDIPINPESIVRKMLTIRGLHNYTPHDLHEALSFLESNHLIYPFAQLVDPIFTIDDVQEAFEFACANKPIRAAIFATACD